jgi:glycosyltransferase involved in cell wall biosynthesis
MAASDIFVLPSRSEGMSNSLLRAMSEGLAVIATRVGAAEEMIDDGEEGLLIPVDDARALATAMRTLVTDGALRSAMGAAARRKVEAEYSIGSVVERIEAEYRAILGR